MQYPIQWTGKALPTSPAVSLLGVTSFRQRKRCCDVTLSRQEGSTMLQLVNAQRDRPASGNTERIFPSFDGPVCTTQTSNCLLDRVLTYKNLI